MKILVWHTNEWKRGIVLFFENLIDKLFEWKKSQSKQKQKQKNKQWPLNFKNNNKKWTHQNLVDDVRSSRWMPFLLDFGFSEFGTSDDFELSVVWRQQVQGLLVLLVCLFFGWVKNWVYFFVFVFLFCFDCFFVVCFFCFLFLPWLFAFRLLLVPKIEGKGEKEKKK